MDVVQLWKDRSKGFWGEAIRYLRLLGNSGFMFSLYALFLAGGYFYPAFIEWLPDTFPAALVIAGLFTYLLTRCPIRTFLKRGDLVFLLPLEPRLQPFFRNSVMYSVIMQSVTIAVIFLLLGPLFEDRVSPETSYFYSVLALLLLVNAWNNAARWAEVRLQEEEKRRLHAGVRGVINAVFCGFLFTTAPFWLIGAVCVIMACLYSFYHISLLRQHPLKWEVLLEMEEKRLSAFYRFVQSFTDVPHIKMSVKRRRFLTAISDRLLWRSGSVYYVLYGKAFIRSGEYFGMYMRLLLVGALVMYAFPYDWFRLGVGLLFLYMTSVQLRSLWYHLDITIWPDLYPVSWKEKKSAFQLLLKQLLIFQTFLLAIIYWLVGTSLLPGFLLLAAGIGAVFLLTSRVSSKNSRSVH
ncbi:ABC-2 type transport system permease protein [Alteribacillus persepolensis]|uniref:ABC-2 type transport system permease protein n=1 Tax=Alteribacillus persepolensis TaxID=568899 RepID=A0A1G8DF27_9BACI|nr:ABC transporter permease [Alteribacillus persepolensis]SDH56194.1 ABC-2 type transport system permease protein [Alteribacillus persepolensis]